MVNSKWNLRIEYIFPEIIINSISVTRIYFHYSHLEFTMNLLPFSLIAYEFTIHFAYSKWICYFFREITKIQFFRELALYSLSFECCWKWCKLFVFRYTFREFTMDNYFSPEFAIDHQRSNELIIFFRQCTMN